MITGKCSTSIFAFPEVDVDSCTSSCASYSGDAKGIVERSNAAFKKYGRKVWLTEFAMTTHPPSNPVGRSRQDSFMREALPLFDATDSIFRYAWFRRFN